jgi:hypothetical protein
MKELNSAIALSDWNRKGFPSMALMTTTVSLGYDWLNTTLDGEMKKKFNEAILNKGVKPGLIEYEKIKPGQKIPEGDWIYTANVNTIINNCGMMIGALAIARDFPQASANTIYYASSSLSNALRSFPLSIIQEIKERDEVSLFFTVNSMKFALNRDFGLSTSLGYKLIKQSFEESGKLKLNQQEKFIYKYITELQ